MISAKHCKHLAMPKINTPVRHLPDDAALADILALLHRSFAYMDGRINPPSSLHRLGRAEVATFCQTGEIWSIGTPPVACVFLTPQQDSLYLGRLAVNADHRGKGLARRLVDLADRRAVALGLPFLELKTRIELIENHHAFARMGFSEVAKAAHPGFEQPTYIVMRRPVSRIPDYTA